MTPLTRAVFATLLIAAGGLWFCVWQDYREIESNRQSLAEQTATARAALERVRLEREVTDRELAAAGRAIRDAEAAAESRRNAPPPNAAVAGWEEKIATLKTLLGRHPEWTIPEISFLSPDEFIFFARDAQLDSEEARRKSLSGLRALAKRKLAHEFHDALHAYALANDGRLPADLSDLNPFFTQPVSEAILSRYALTGLATVAQAGPGDWVLYERTPVDELYDTRHLLGIQSSIQIPTNPETYVIARALAAYAAAHPGRPPTESVELTSYLEVPIDAATLGQYFSGWQKNPATFGATRMKTTSVMIFSPIGTPAKPKS